MSHAVWRMPILIAAITAAGLVSGLLEDGLWDAFSWLGLGLPLATIAWGVTRSLLRRSSTR